MEKTGERRKICYSCVSRYLGEYLDRAIGKHFDRTPEPLILLQPFQNVLLKLYREIIYRKRDAAPLN